jgi:hypothetical protein
MRLQARCFCGTGIVAAAEQAFNALHEQQRQPRGVWMPLVGECNETLMGLAPTALLQRLL